MLASELLRKKRDGAELTPEEIRWFVAASVSGAVTEPQVAAFLMAACIRGLSLRETAALTQAMCDSGVRFSWHHLGKPIIDKHSTGGVGDKISLVLVPLVAACGVLVPMISGRALGHTGGTVDKWESILGLRTEFSTSELERLLQDVGGFIIGQSAAIAPADRLFYRLRDVTGTVESIGLITASILSKKLAEDLDGLVLDIKVGSGAFLPTYEHARQLAQAMEAVAQELQLPLRIVFSRMDTPLGYAVGNWWEVREAEQALRSPETAPADVRVITEQLAAEMLCLAHQLPHQEALERVRSVWHSGTAWERFHALVRAQGGRWEESVAQYEQLHPTPLHAWEDGYITALEARTVGLAALLLGAGRRTEHDQVDPAAGILLHRKPGDRVRPGDLLASLYSRSAASLPEALALLRHAYHFGEEPPEPEPILLEKAP
ncbi:Thymidine phosphorylase [bacterium HR21]|jgi:pyrimidine-nucleoside phosphorylase|nr:Thymidine phosphorylase [bacterium HR21]